ncbi:MAG: UPF0175 family protein [Cyanobacteriota bacterium]|nr:UPF0175 family protein [Cyanobacteriota bacterium]
MKFQTKWWNVRKGEWSSVEERLLEIFVADAYRCGAIATSEVRRLLQLSSRLETHAFLKRMGVYLNYDEEELERDLQTIKDIQKLKSSRIQ